jgi:hypothetical protein
MIQAEAQPRISNLMVGKINLFSLDTLMDMATTAGLEPQSLSRNSRLRASVRRASRSRRQPETKCRGVQWVTKQRRYPPRPLTA